MIRLSIYDQQHVYQGSVPVPEPLTSTVRLSVPPLPPLVATLRVVRGSLGAPTLVADEAALAVLSRLEGFEQ